MTWLSYFISVGFEAYKGSSISNGSYSQLPLPGRDYPSVQYSQRVITLQICCSLIVCLTLWLLCSLLISLGISTDLHLTRLTGDLVVVHK